MDMDIVARIRRENINQRGHGHVIAMAMEAADLIERLREELDKPQGEA